MRWRGQVEAWGLWFPPGATTPERLLKHWKEGSPVLLAYQGWLLVFPRSQRLDADRIAALPIVRIGEGWASFPSARPQREEVVLKWQGVTWSGSVSALEPLDLASLWESSSLRYDEGVPIVRAMELTPQVVPISIPAQTSIRQILTTIPEAAPEQKEWLQRMRQTKSAKKNSNPLLGFLALLSSFFDSHDNQRYMSKMMDLFEREQWNDALRYAIPLNAEESRQTLERFFGKLAPRKDLQFTAKYPGGYSIGTSTPGIDLLESLYQRAFDSLKRSGKTEEAAFVKAELLGDIDGALKLLEQHKLFGSAANLATLKGQPAAQQVRLWFQAGQTERALRLARCHSVHAEALHILEQRDAKRAEAFRADWVRDLAEARHLSEAVLVGWPIRSDLPGYEAWLLETLDGEDLAASRVMALAVTDPELSRRIDLASRLQSWFKEDNPFTVRRRRHLLDQLVRQRVTKASPEIQAWANGVARQVMRQSHTPWSLGDNKVLESLVKLSGDPWLNVDQPQLPKPLFHLNRWHQVVEQRGRLSIFDAAAIGDGRLLVALGHTGLAVLSSRGAYSQKFDLPTHDLVTPLKGDLFLTISQGRIGCFQKGRARSLRSAAFDGFADCHDSLAWFVWCGSELFRIDLASLTHPERSLWQALSSLPLDTQPYKLSVGPKTFSVLTESHIAYYDTPEMKLLESKPVSTTQPVLLTPHLSFHSRERRLSFAGNHLFIRQELLSFDFQAPYGIVTSGGNDGLTLCIFHTSTPKQQFVLDLPGAQFAKVRVQEREVVICDSTGRLLIADPLTQTWLGQFFL
jgi:MoxR-vWA-beta-propeller ternary system domain bpX6